MPCSFENIHVDKCLCDLGSNINLMVPKIVVLQLTDHSVRCSIGIIEDMLVKIGNFYFLTDFFVLEMEEDVNMLIILGRVFMVTGRALIDVLEGKLILRVGEDRQELICSSL